MPLVGEGKKSPALERWPMEAQPEDSHTSRQLLQLCKKAAILNSFALRRFLLRTQQGRPRSGSVRQDWSTPLSAEKYQTYTKLLHRLETAYAMFSVNLDEALGMRQCGRVGKAYQILGVSPALCERLMRPLVGSLRAMVRHARHFGVAPNLMPLDPENFHNAKCQRVARLNAVFSRILLTRKSQLIYKITALADLTEELAGEYQTIAEELTESGSTRPERSWEVLDAAHYDLNTCLRETEVLLKSFFHALPERQLSEFQTALREHVVGPFFRPKHVAHRRMMPIKGQ